MARPTLQPGMRPTLSVVSADPDTAVRPSALSAEPCQRAQHPCRPNSMCYLLHLLRVHDQG
jgi:hypothetical protein